MKRWRVWTAQVNQAYYDVEAEDKDMARVKAMVAWGKENTNPDIIYVAEILEKGGSDATS